MLFACWKARTKHLGCGAHVRHIWDMGHALDTAVRVPTGFYFYFLKSDEYGKYTLRHNWDKSWAKKTKRAENLKHTVTLSTDLLPLLLLLLLLTEIGPTLLQFPPSALFPCLSMCDLSLFCLPHTITNT